jgi:enoyl-CoA hydratase
MSIRVDDQAADRLVVTLDRPDKRNAIDAVMVAALHGVCDRLDALAAINSALFARIRVLPLPTVAALAGPALGGGAELAYACDLRVCTARTVFGQPEVRLGIIAGAGGTYRLPALVGETRAKELLFTGRRVDAAEAHAIGLVNEVVAEPADLLSAAHRLPDEIAKASPLALRLTKLAVDASAAAHPQLDLVSQAVLFEDDEKHRRMTEFLERRRR